MRKTHLLAIAAFVILLVMAGCVQATADKPTEPYNHGISKSEARDAIQSALVPYDLDRVSVGRCDNTNHSAVRACRTQIVTEPGERCFTWILVTVQFGGGVKAWPRPGQDCLPGL